MEISQVDDTRVWVMVPHVKERMGLIKVLAVQKILLDSMLESIQIDRYVLWYYSPMALSWSDHLAPLLIIYDCMDELSAFKFTPPCLIQREQKLIRKADLVFTGGQSHYLAKRHLHDNVHPFPSSIDKVHFSIALNGAASASIFIAAAEEILTKVGYKKWLEKVDGFLSGISWDKIWQRMNELINTAIEDKRKAKKAKRYV